MPDTKERERYFAYVAIALAGLLAGMALGQLESMREPGRSRIDWPTQSQPHPRTLNP